MTDSQHESPTHSRRRLRTIPSSPPLMRVHATAGVRTAYNVVSILLLLSRGQKIEKRSAPSETVPAVEMHSRWTQA
jgi:hypothetical protein